MSVCENLCVPVLVCISACVCVYINVCGLLHYWPSSLTLCKSNGSEFTPGVTAFGEICQQENFSPKNPKQKPTYATRESTKQGMSQQDTVLPIMLLLVMTARDAVE